MNFFGTTMEKKSLNLTIMQMKMFMFILLWQTAIPGSSQINNQAAINTRNTPSFSNTLNGSMVTSSNVTEKIIQWTKKRSRLPLPVYLNTVDERSMAGTIQSISDSAIIFSAKPGSKQGEANNMEISYTNIRQIKIRNKNGILKGFFYGTGIGLLPAIGGAIIGKGEGGAYVSVITFPLGVITGTLIGTSRKKFNINGNASSFSDFKKRIE